MSDLLTIGRSGVLAYKGALAAVGENVTNSDTEGYARRSVVLREQATYTGPATLNRTSSAFGGVQVAGVTRVWDQYKASEAWTSNSDNSGASTRTKYLSTMETLLNDTTSGVGTRLTAVFNAASQLSATPADISLRQTFLNSVSDAANALNTTAGNLSSLSNTLSTQSNLLTTETNSALAALNKVNQALRGSPASTPARAQLEDQRDSLLGTISGAVAIDTSFGTDGTVTVRLNNNTGPLLVSPKDFTASTLSVTTATDGRLDMTVRVGSETVSARPAGGTLAGLIDSSETNLGQRQRLDKIAMDLKDLLNGFQANGLTDAGVAAAATPGADPLVNPDMLTGTDAASFALAKVTVTEDPLVVRDFNITDLALAEPDGAANGNLLKLADARGSGGVEQQWKSLVTQQSLLVSSAKLQESAASSRKNTAYTALDATTGVDLDTEAAELLRFQQAYSASAKIIQAARETLQDILNLF